MPPGVFLGRLGHGGVPVSAGRCTSWWDPILKSCGLGGPILKSLKSLPGQVLSLPERSILKVLKAAAPRDALKTSKGV